MEAWHLEFLGAWCSFWSLVWKLVSICFPHIMHILFEWLLIGKMGFVNLWSSLLCAYTVICLCILLIKIWAILKFLKILNIFYLMRNFHNVLIDVCRRKKFLLCNEKSYVLIYNEFVDVGPTFLLWVLPLSVELMSLLDLSNLYSIVCMNVGS